MNNSATIDELLHKIKMLEERNAVLENDLCETKEHLKKYTAPSRAKKYYETQKETLLKKMKENTPDKDKIKEKNRKAYLKRKELLESNLV
jgi:hypothetical protein